VKFFPGAQASGQHVEYMYCTDRGVNRRKKLLVARRTIAPLPVAVRCLSRRTSTYRLLSPARAQQDRDADGSELSSLRARAATDGPPPATSRANTRHMHLANSWQLAWLHGRRERGEPLRARSPRCQRLASHRPAGPVAGSAAPQRSHTWERGRREGRAVRKGGATRLPSAARAHAATCRVHASAPPPLDHRYTAANATAAPSPSQGLRRRGRGTGRPSRWPCRRAPPRYAGAGCTWRGARSGTGRPS
jgi:hypothetical protein